MNMKNIRANALQISHSLLGWLNDLGGDTDALKQMEFRHYRLCQYLDRKGE